MDEESKGALRGYHRILNIFESVAEQGPLTLEDVVKATGIPRTACFRSLKVLEDQGWIRPQMGSGAFAVTAGFGAKLRRAQKTYEEIDQLWPLLKPIARDKKVHFDIAVLEDLIVPRVVESTRRKSIQDPPGFFENPFSLVSLAAEDPRMRMMALKAAIEIASPAQADAIRNGGLNTKIRAIGLIGEHEDRQNNAMILPINGISSFTGALRVGSSVSGQPRLDVIAEVVTTLQSGNFPSIPTKLALQSLNA